MRADARVAEVFIDITAPDGVAEAYVARPTPTQEPAENLPGVLMFMDAIGVRPRITQMADRIASWGYVVLVPNVFYREGTMAQVAPRGPLDSDEAYREFFDVAMPRAGRLTPQSSGPDTDVWLSTLLDLDGVRRPVAAVGYCMGARLAVRAACDHPEEIVAAAGFHGGRLATDAEDSPHLGLPRARAEFLFGHADQDASMAPEAVARLGEALDAAGLVATNEIYPGAAHGYTMADTRSYDAAATERHFSELQALLERTLG